MRRNMTIPNSDDSQSLELFRRSVLLMLDLLDSDEISHAERKRAVSTIRDALKMLEAKQSIAASVDQLKVREATRPAVSDYTIRRLETQEEKFAEKLKELMKSKAISQIELAARTGCSQPAISQMLKRRCRPQRSTILNLAAALDVDPRELWPNLDVTDLLDTVAAVQEDREMSETEADTIRRTLDGPSANTSALQLPPRKM